VTWRKPAATGIAALALVGCAARPPSTVVFLSDFGTSDDSVAICKGVMLGIEPRLQIVDLTHQVPPYSIADGARLLAGTAAYYRPGTVFLAVVDPGVGGARRAIVVRSRHRGQYFVVPDNGLVTLVADRDGVREAREITNPAWLGDRSSSTFHGRDVFAPVAARIARGDDWTAVGAPVERLVRIEIATPRLDERRLTGMVLALDGPYGNLVTNVEAGSLAELGWRVTDRVPVAIGGRKLVLPYVRTFGDVAAGEPLLYVDSRGHVALAINRGSFAKRYGIEPPVPLAIRRRPP